MPRRGRRHRLETALALIIGSAAWSSASSSSGCQAAGKSGAAYFRRKASSVARPAESESRRTTVLNTARDGALTIDSNGRIQSTNPAVERSGQLQLPPNFGVRLTHRWRERDSNFRSPDRDDGFRSSSTVRLLPERDPRSETSRSTRSWPRPSPPHRHRHKNIVMLPPGFERLSDFVAIGISCLRATSLGRAACSPSRCAPECAAAAVADCVAEQRSKNPAKSTLLRCCGTSGRRGSGPPEPGPQRIATFLTPADAARLASRLR
jgi:hypothetical protein